MSTQSDSPSARVAEQRHRLAQRAPATGESLLGQQLLALVDDGHVEADRAGQRRRGPRDVAGAKEPQPRRRLDRFDEDLHAPAAAHAQVVAEIAREQLARAGALRLAQRLEHRVLDRAAAHGADGAAVGTKQQARARLLRRRPGGAHHGGERAAPTALQQLDERLGDLTHVEKFTTRALAIGARRDRNSSVSRPFIVVSPSR